MRPPSRPAGLAIAASAIALSACGGGDASSEPQTATARGEVRKAVERFYGAIGDGDANVACAGLTSDARRKLVAALANVAMGPGCEGAMRFAIAKREPAAGSRAPILDITRITGDSARAEVILSVDGGPTVTLPLVEQAGRWRIAAAPAAG
jgi:hypothetical protein